MKLDSHDPAAAAALATHSLSKRYRRGSWALRDVSIALDPGSITALVGPNGAGKTTLIRVWVGFERATLGSAEVLGADPWRQRKRTTAHVCYISQHPTLYGRLNVQDHVDLAHHFRRGFDREGATRRLHQLGIDRRARAGELSGGQQAQLGLVLAIGTRAEVLLLDEPLASLDPLARREFLTILVETVRELNATTVLSSHALSDIEVICDRLILLADGRVRFDDTVERALAYHVVASEPTTTTDISNVIGSFADLRGDSSTLLQVQQPGIASGARPATLEEVVMGYLARDRA